MGNLILYFFSVMYKNIETVMHSCEERTGKLDLSNLSLRPMRFQPILKAIQHQSCLRELELKGQVTESFNSIPNKPLFLCVCSINLLKTLWEKEKLLKMSNFSFSHNVFYPFRELSAIFIKFEIFISSFFQFGRV